MAGMGPQDVSPAVKLRVLGSPCDLCQSGDHEFLFQKGDYGYFRCASCGLVASDYEATSPAELYDGLFEQAWLEREVGRTLTPRKQAIYVRQLKEHVESVGDSCVLDVGCGVGGFLKAARDLGAQVHGLEASAVAGRYAREELAIDVTVADVEGWRPETPRFDLVRANALLEHLKSPRRALTAIAAATKSGGTLFGLTLSAASWTFRRAGARWRYLGMGGHVTLFTPQTLKRYLVESGFAEARVWSTGYREEKGALPGVLENLVGLAARPLGAGHRLYFRAIRD